MERMIIYYNKKLMKQTQTQSEDTIPMTDELMADYRHYASNQQDKSLELIQEVGQVPYLKRYKLGEDGNRYSLYTDTKDSEGFLLPDTVAINNNLLQTAKDKKISQIDRATAEAIEALVGDNNKQKDLLAHANTLTRKEANGTATVDDIETLDALEQMNEVIKDLKFTGNNREAIVALVEITTTLEDALAEIEAI